MIKSVLFGGAAGQGVDRTTVLMGKILTSAGFFCFLNREYSSLIRGGHNFDVLTFSNQPIFSQENKIDLLIALDKETIACHRKKLKPNGLIVGSHNLFSRDIGLKIDVDSFWKKHRLQPVFGNNVLVGSLMKYFSLPLLAGFRVVEQEFGKKEAVSVKEAIRFGYFQAGCRKKLMPQKRKIHFLKGNDAVARGAFKAGLEMGFYYPITPATGVFDELERLAGSSQRVKLIQLENEIAVINAALGASFAGAMSFVATSGPGFSLMTEALSLAGMAEIPIVIYLVTRPGPATGMPTFTSQEDLKFALSAGHGEFPRVVVAPGDANEAFSKIIESFYLAHKYRLPAIVLGDKHLAESYFSFKKAEKVSVRSQKFITRPTVSYKNYKITKTGVSPRLVPGQGSIVRAASYEHDEDGYTTEDGRIAVLMREKRQRKTVFAAKEISGKLKPVKVFGRGENLIVSWGSTKGVILDSLKKLSDWRFLQIVYLEPFPTEQVAKELKRAQRVILVEGSSTGFIGQLIRQQTGFLIKDKILKYDGRAFTSDELVAKINHF